jgi:NADPH:quinone reductase
LRAVQISTFGIENIAVTDIDDPAPVPGEVLIAAEAATINPVDLGIVTGALAPNFPPGTSAPYTPGWDVAGRVIEVGEGVDGALLGTRVIGFSPWMNTGQGTQSSLVTLPVANIAVAGDGLTSSQLTTVGLNGLTAWRAVDELHPTRNETVVITGAAGSVGGFALDLVIARGARVIAAVSERDRESMLSRGAHHVVTREQGDLAMAVRTVVPDGVDGLLDTASIAGPSLAAIRDAGRYVTVTALPDPERSITVARIVGVADAQALAALVGMTTSTGLQTPVAREFDIEDAKAAYREFASGPHRGRIVLTFPK